MPRRVSVRVALGTVQVWIEDRVAAFSEPAPGDLGMGRVRAWGMASGFVAADGR